MSGVAIPAEGGSPPHVPENVEPEINEGVNVEGENIWVHLNNSEDNKHTKMIETVISLKAELLSVKTDNECILKAQEELNNVILNKLLSQEEIKKKEPINQPDGTASYKRKARRIDPLGSDSSSSNEDQVEQHKNETKNSSEPNHSESWKDKKKRRYHDEITGEFKKIKPPTFNGEVETGEEAEAFI